MSKLFKTSEQRGTLLIEALAMLGLIAMVTPTLYKKSAERLQEIQDINAASQARTMGSVMDAFIRQNFSGLMSSMSGEDHDTIVIDFEDDQAGAYRVGYSSYLPYGFTPNEIRGYDAPKVYVRRDNSTLVSYVLYPKIVDIGNKRAARMASLIGANGGVITDNREAKGTGGAWYLNSSMIEDMEIDDSSLTENSIMITSSEPISMSYDDSAKYLYRVPPSPATDDSAYYHNTMVTDLYMGGHPFDDTDYATYANDYYSIFNVKKLTMNTNCNRAYVAETISSTTGDFCDPNVADLYIGKPFAIDNHGTLNTADHSPAVEGNTGAAWIYGNLAALSESFQLFREESLGTGYNRNTDGYDDDLERTSAGWDVLQFARMNSSGTGDEEVVILRAENAEGNERVAMMDDFVQVKRRAGASSIVDFLVGESSGVGGEGALIKAFRNGSTNEVHINRESDSSITEINRQGGTVYINGGSSASTNMLTYINDMGGKLNAGHDGGWLMAQGFDNSARVHLLANVTSSGTDNRVFSVGHDVDDNGSVGAAYNTNHMIYADTDKVSLRGGGIRVYSGEGYTGEEAGSIAFQPTADNAIKNEYADLSGTELEHLTTIASKFTDIMGRTYMGNKNMSSTASDDGKYTRNEFTLGVAGSAWVDELLWARRAWLKQAGMQELHAGFESYSQFVNAPQTAWLNAYDDMVVIRNKAKGGTNDKRGEMNTGKNDLMFLADSTKVLINDTDGAWAAFEDGSSRIGAGDPNTGALKNYFLADTVGGDGSANVVGSTLVNLYTLNDSVSSVVDVQREAMRFGGHWSSSYTNRIDAKTGKFTIKTKDVSSTDEDEGAQFFADADKIRTRWVDFQVEDDSSTVRFKVAPNMDPDSETADANVQVNGSFHVTGNEVIHIASNSSNAVGTADNDHAMFEIDPEYIQVWAKDTDGNYAPGGSSAGGYYAMLKINPTDVRGGSSSIDDTRDASIYIRKGAIELEDSYGSSGGSSSTFAADEGFGYIKANRFVSNTNEVVPEIAGKEDRGTMYDQYMVNPAYTSVMHDIKLTTRGGARLSDILPDFILKGVYNVSNDFVEGSKTKRIAWSCGDQCQGATKVYEPHNEDVAWADPYVGRIPYALCPPGYMNMATLIPISFNMGQAGEIIQANKFAPSYDSEAGGNDSHPSKRWIVNPASRQASILETAMTLQGGGDMNDAIIYPGMEEVSSLIYNGTFTTDTSHSAFLPQVMTRTEGWYLGLKAYYTDANGTATDSYLKSNSSGTSGQNLYSYTYSKDGSDKYIVAQPLYFQQNTWLKTALQPYDEGWHGRIGFIYDKDFYNLGDGAGDEGMYSNNNEDGYNDVNNPNPMFHGNFVWNLFPVPTNTLEGHATVYCYFDRSQFQDSNWADKVDQIDQLGSYRDPKNKSSGTNAGYLKRLHDPSLKYSDPW